MKSKKYTLNKADLLSIAKGLTITLSGAALTYISEVVAKTDFGDFSPIAVAVFALLVNIGRKFIGGK